jgi:hypothetical protein
MTDEEIIAEHCPDCFDVNHYKTSNNTLKTRLQNCFAILFNLAEDQIISISQFESLCGKLVGTVENAIDLYLPVTMKERFYKSTLIPPLFLLIDQMNLPSLFEEVILPFFADSGNDTSLSLSVGPGSEITQMVPHDTDFFKGVFARYKRNVLMVFEGGIEGDFGDMYKDIFSIDERSELFENVWFSKFFSYIIKLFAIRDPASISIEKYNTVTKIITIPHDKNITKIILYLGDYLGPNIEPSIEALADSVGSLNLICGIRSGSCNELFFRDSNLFYSKFHFYVFTHQDTTVENLKNTSQSFRIDLKRLRNAGVTKNSFLKNISKQSNNTNAGGYPVSILCKRENRLPANDPYCVQGNLDKNIFWKGLGGKRRSTRRKVKKTKKTRKH